MPITGVASGIGHRFALAMAQVLGHLRLKRSLHQHLGKLLEQPVLAYQVSRLLVIRQQAVCQLEEFRIGFLSFVAFR
ncbi:NAD(P)-dependent dehydrogenase (short-subunit alcohol dehydrogenase family) [Paraburkholderia sp. Clong3]